jgi:hypothetical protein
VKSAAFDVWNVLWGVWVDLETATGAKDFKFEAKAQEELEGASKRLLALEAQMRAELNPSARVDATTLSAPTPAQAPSPAEAKRAS